MYLIPVEIRDSSIEGKGVFALEDIDPGTVVWKYNPEYDKSISLDDFERLSNEEKSDIEKVGYISTESNQWIYPSENDPARYTNHSQFNNLSVVFDKQLSVKPVFITKRGIKAGEELTNNYLEFDQRIIAYKPSWL